MAIHAEAVSGNWNYPSSIRFGAGRIRELPDACSELGIRSPLIVTDPGLAALPVVDLVLTVCREAGLSVGLFSDIQGNPVGKNVDDGVAAFKAAGHDGVVAFGGGSGLDAAKAIALMVGQTRPIWDFEDREDWHTRVNVDGMVPLVAVPTTSGTGSEVGRVAVITDQAEKVKKLIFHANMMPARVILDPELTVGLPANITAWVGMDALSHSLEAYCTPVYHPLGQGVALESMRLIKEWLPIAVHNGQDTNARAHMQVASMMGATAFQKGLGAMHAMSHPCGAVLDTHHGLTNAVVMPYVLKFNHSAIDEKMIALARYLDLPNPSFDAVLSWVMELRETVGIEASLKEIGVADANIDTLAPMAAVDPSAGTNPIALTTENLKPLFADAINGRI